MVANGLKLGGGLVNCFGLYPLLGYSPVSVSAAAYSPAKYGVLNEIICGEQLIKAIGLMEAPTIVAILTGSVADRHIVAALAVCALAIGAL